MHSEDGVLDQGWRGTLALGLGAIVLFILPPVLAQYHDLAISRGLGVAGFIAFIFFPTLVHTNSSPKWRDKLRLVVPLVLLALLVVTKAGEFHLFAAIVVAGVGLVILWRRVFDPDNGNYLHFSMVSWMILAFAAGFVAVSMELVWFRTLFTYFRGNAYVFGPMLGVFLLCDGLGMWVAAKLVEKNPKPGLAFLSAQISAIVLALVMYLAFIAAPRWETSLGNMMSASLVLMGIPCFFLGFTFPFIQRAIQDDNAKIASRIGLILFFNTLGNTAGGIVAAFVLLGFLGTIGSIFVIAALSLIVALWCFARKTARAPMAIISCSIVILCACYPDNRGFWLRIHGLNIEKRLAEQSIVSEDYSGICLITVRDTSTRYYLDSRDETFGTLHVSGYRQGDIPFGRNQTMSGVIGAAFHPEPKDVLCIGVGSAATPFLIGMRGSVEKIDMVELAEAEIPALLSATERDFGRYLKPVFSDKRYTLHIADGRKFLFNSGLYDIIQTDMRTSESAGSGAIYSREFYEHAARHLKPGGYVIQQTFGETTHNTMQAVFPYVYSFGLFTIGTNQPITVSSERVIQYFENELSPNLLAAGLNPNPIRRFLSEQMELDFVQLPRLSPDVKDVVINTDFLPRDEFYLNTSLISSDFSPRKWLFSKE